MSFGSEMHRLVSDGVGPSTSSASSTSAFSGALAARHSGAGVRSDGRLSGLGDIDARGHTYSIEVQMLTVWHLIWQATDLRKIRADGHLWSIKSIKSFPENPRGRV